jgi:hypothetical protein
MGKLANVDLNALGKMIDKRLERSTLRHEADAETWLATLPELKPAYAAGPKV